MIGAFTDYVIYGGIAFILGWLVYRSWDRIESKKASGPIQAGAWLDGGRDIAVDPGSFSEQELHDYSLQYMSVLKAAFARPTDKNLAQLAQVLRDPRNLHGGLWQPMNNPIGQTYLSYKMEFEALLSAVLEQSTDPVQLYAAYQLASRLPHPPSKMAKLADALYSNPATAPALKAARTARQV